ncbi:alpha/beta hydrolase family protein [Nocardioides caeni]|uniref:Alpha/beta hydrolase n=1 Tax=Nocardioides caeni TaxID=574700 RepID=A0A4S8NPA9_9ACTN|nr:prolyl oligopeptidase family serine peptidase [Nocardioides caeni]THV18092.1 alpha/beta hydrolase [Nocardioides caeni]
MKRRSLLALGAGAVAAGLAGCADQDSQDQPDGEESDVRDEPAGERIDYGPDPSQYGELHRPAGATRGVVVVVHGGYWSASYGLELGTPLAEDLARRGWLAWNVEYRRIGAGPGGGGGARATVDDVAAAVAVLRELPDWTDGWPVVGLGHSAGGHLITCVAGLSGNGGLTAVVSQAGVLDLRAAHREGLGGGAVEAFLGHPPGPDDIALDPVQRVPLAIPVTCVHGTADRVVPLTQSTSYVDTARAAGAVAELVEVPGDHFDVIDPTTPAWAEIVTVLATAGR